MVVSLKERITIQLNVDKLFSSIDELLPIVRYLRITKESMGMGTFPLSISTENRYSDITGPGPPSNQQSPQLTRLLSESTPVMDPVTLHRRDTELPI